MSRVYVDRLDENGVLQNRYVDDVSHGAEVATHVDENGDTHVVVGPAEAQSAFDPASLPHEEIPDLSAEAPFDEDQRQAAVDGPPEAEAPAAPAEELAPALEDLTVVELQELAAENDISGRSAMNKDELIAALEEAGV